VLPVLTLSTAYVAYIARLTRAGMLEVLRQDFIRTARAKGLAESVVVLKHALKLGILPVVSYLGPAAARIIMGSIVVEQIFAIPDCWVRLVDLAHVNSIGAPAGRERLAIRVDGESAVGGEVAVRRSRSCNTSGQPLL